MKKVQPSGAQNRKKKRGRDEEESKQKGALDSWIKRSKEEAEKEEHDVGVAEDSSDMESENKTVSSQSPCQNDDSTSTSSSEENKDDHKEDFNTMTFFQKHDFGYLKKPVPDNLRMTIVQHGPERYQHKSGPFAEKDGRSLSRHWFEKVSTNGETVARKWLLYSPYQEVCHCFVCFLFSKQHGSSAASFSKEEGFSTWKKLNPRVSDHETSPSHRACMREYLNLVVRLHRSATIDAELQQQSSAEKEKWKAVTARIVEVVSFLAQQNLAFRGHRGEGISNLSESEDTVSENTGNFLATIRLMAKYDVILAEHLQRGKDKPKSVTYLSNRSQNEIIDLLGETVKKNIISEIKDAKYFSIMLDSTPDIAHEDQVSEILRYVHINEDRTVEIKEVFVGFFQISKKDAGSLANKILEKLEEDKIPISDCRGQTYDNAAVMAGVRGGVQQKIIEVNPKAVFVNCENHSLNLACVHASEVQPVVVTFFGTLEKVFTFFSSSTSRWEVLKSFVSRTVKRQCDTRWSARHDAVQVIYEDYDNIIASLEHLHEGEFSRDTKSDAGSLLNSIQQFTFISLLKFWYPILSSVQKVTKRLQDSKIGFHEASSDLTGLVEIVNLKYEEIIDHAIKSAEDYCEEWEIPIARSRRKKRMPGELARDSGLTAQQEMRRVMVEIINRLKTELQDRSVRLQDLADRFWFLLNLNSFNIGDEQGRDKLRKACSDFATCYENDVTAIQLYDEITDFVMLVRAGENTVPSDPKDVMEALVKFGKDIFPTVCIAYRLLLTIAFSIASCERSFSKLKLIKTYLRSSMSQERLTNLAIISIEKEFLSSDVKKEVVELFSERRAHLGHRN